MFQFNECEVTLSGGARCIVRRVRPDGSDGTRYVVHMVDPAGNRLDDFPSLSQEDLGELSKVFQQMVTTMRTRWIEVEHPTTP